MTSLTLSPVQGPIFASQRKRAVEVRKPVRDLSDEELLARCAEYDESAFSELFSRYRALAFRYISRLLSTRSVHDIEDLVQQTLVEVWKSSGRFRRDWKPKSWILGIATNLSRHHLRTEARRFKAMKALSLQLESRVRRPCDDLEQEQLVRQLGEALQELPYDLRVAYVLCDIEGLRGVDAAQALEIRAGTLWRRLHYARKELKLRMTNLNPA